MDLLLAIKGDENYLQRKYNNIQCYCNGRGRHDRSVHSVKVCFIKNKFY